VSDRIVAVGSRQQLQQRYPGAEIVDCSGRIVMPGMVNTHTHLFQTLLKGLGDDSSESPQARGQKWANQILVGGSAHTPAE
jgi:cytosine/adenosine deaminase-related metal-dependent hydrolase